MSFTMFVPVSQLEQHFRRQLSLNEWEDICLAAGLEVKARFRLDEMREAHRIDWWDPDYLVIGEVSYLRKLPDTEQLYIVGIDFGPNRYAKILTSTESVVHFIDCPKEQLSELRVPYAAVGAKVVDANSSRRPRPLRKVMIERFRDYPSDGMVCSECEVGLSEYHQDIFLLPGEAVPGTSLQQYLGNEVLSLSIAAKSWTFLNLEFVIDCITPQMEARTLVGSSH